jgi:anti-sigma factor RsiW
MTKAKAQKEIEQPKHIETASEKYRRLKNESFDAFLDESFTEEALKDVATETVTAPSGMEFVVRRANTDFFFTAGYMPNHLANKIQTGEMTEEQLAKQMTAEEQERAHELSWRTVFYGCIEPRIVVHASAANQIALSDLVTGDRIFLTDAITRGGKEAERLRNFRRGR